MIMNKITTEDISSFIAYLKNKECKGSKSYNKTTEEIDPLASSTVFRYFTILTAGFPDAKNGNT